MIANSQVLTKILCLPGALLRAPQPSHPPTPVIQGPILQMRKLRLRTGHLLQARQLEVAGGGSGWVWLWQGKGVSSRSSPCFPQEHSRPCLCCLEGRWALGVRAAQLVPAQ